MGLGNIIATGFSIMILIVVGYLIIAGLSYAISAVTSSAVSVRELKSDQAGMMLAVSGVTKLNSTTMAFTVANTGTSDIDDLSKMDVIVKFVDISSKKCLAARWLAPASMGGDDVWYSTGIRSPMRNTIGSAMLMPGEAMTVNAILDTPPESNDGIVAVSAPDGVTATAQFHLGG
ncbi:MAG TPA: hypothetical protein VK436_13640 [Methanocella sp.]|nr:hypothetical protein [Methanocella sp.]